MGNEILCGSLTCDLMASNGSRKELVDTSRQKDMGCGRAFNSVII